MCTVTLTPIEPAGNNFVLTSNRDEAVLRETLAPEMYLEQGVRLLYPKDVVAGGTWIGLSENRRAICLLNGGFESHVPNPPYRKSRGVVVKEFLASDDLLEQVETCCLQEIEPFTCIMVDWNDSLCFYELVWDGGKKHLHELPLKDYIWSSSLLYSEDIKRERETRFRKFKEGLVLNPDNLLEFHCGTGSDQKEGLIINKGSLKTLSITQISKTGEQVRMKYRDLLKKQEPVIRYFETS